MHFEIIVTCDSDLTCQRSNQVSRSRGTRQNYITKRTLVQAEKPSNARPTATLSAETIERWLAYGVAHIAFKSRAV
jgi:hypothetical protein